MQRNKLHTLQWKWMEQKKTLTNTGQRSSVLPLTGFATSWQTQGDDGPVVVASVA